MKNEVPLGEQFRIVLAICLAILAFILVIAGSDHYIKEYDLPRWLEIVFNILSFLFSIVVGGAVFGYYLPPKK